MNPLTVERGKRSEAGRVADLAAAAADLGGDIIAAAEQVVYNTGQLFANLLSNPVADGTYTIRLLKGGKHLHIVGGCHGSNGCDVKLWDYVPSAANRFRFTVKKEIGAYTIGNSANKGLDFLEIDANDLLDNYGQAQMWEANLPFGGHSPNQLWHFYAVPNRPNHFVIRSVSSGKVLSAKGATVNQNGGQVWQKDGTDNNPYQVWILERAN